MSTSQGYGKEGYTGGQTYFGSNWCIMAQDVEVRMQSHLRVRICRLMSTYPYQAEHFQTQGAYLWGRICVN